MSTVRNIFSVSSPVSNPHFTAGIECEIEDLSSICASISCGGYWKIEEDGSLRNEGREFISPPSSKSCVVEEFTALHSLLMYKSEDKKARFHPRTSTHVHVNCLFLEEEQVKTIIMWYALFEPVFFLLVSPVRRNNIHCVGLDQTILSENYKRPLKTLHKCWSKYTALNILPLSKYGTLEFRHLQGTDDSILLENWLTVLENLWNLGRTTPLTKDSVKNEGAIMEVYEKIFKDCPEAMKLSPVVPSLISNSLIDIKLSLI